MLLLLIINSCLGQNVSLNDLFIICRKPNWTEVNDLMIKKGWEYYESKEGDSENYNTIVWSFNKSDYSEKAQGWLNLYTVDNVPQRVKCDFFNKQTYESLQKNISALKLNQVNSAIKDDYIQTQYSNSEFNVVIKISKVEKGDSFEEVTMPAYSIAVVKKNGVYDEYNGVKRTYYDDGTLKNEYTLKNGFINGVTKSFHPNGKLKTTSFFVNNIRHGFEKTYGEDGVIVSEYNYNDGIGDGTYKVFKYGKIAQIGSLKRDVYDGIFKNYDGNGNLIKEFFMKEGLLHGSFKEILYEGNKKIFEEIGQYENGEEVGRWEVFKFNQENKSDLLRSTHYVNGEKHGSFKEVKSDSIIFGSYNNDELSGPYYIYTNVSYLLNGKISGDTTGCPLTVFGLFNSGLKDGQWKYFDLTGSLIREGMYEDDLEQGEWRYYFRKMFKNKKETEFSQMKFLTDKYGKLDGKTVRLGYQKEYKTPCDSTDLLFQDTQDSCLRIQYKRIYQMRTYKNGILNGLSEERDSMNNLLSSGGYKDGLKSGIWVQYFLNKDIDGEKYYRHFEGAYLLNKREGNWKEYKGGRLISEIEFREDRRHGKTISYDWGETEFSEHIYMHGMLTKLIVYSLVTKDTAQIYEIKSELNKTLHYRFTEFHQGKKISRKECKLVRDDGGPVDVYSLVYLHGITSYTDGRFEKYDERGRIVEEGSQYKNKKIDIWKFYDYDQKIILEKYFEANITIDPIEHFYTLGSGKPYSGILTINHSNGKTMYEIKVKGGLREGKSKQFDEQGRVLKVEKYKMGLVVK